MFCLFCLLWLVFCQLLKMFHLAFLFKSFYHFILVFQKGVKWFFYIGILVCIFLFNWLNTCFALKNWESYAGIWHELDCLNKCFHGWEVEEDSSKYWTLVPAMAKQTTISIEYRRHGCDVSPVEKDQQLTGNILDPGAKPQASASSFRNLFRNRMVRINFPVLFFNLPSELNRSRIISWTLLVLCWQS